MLNSLPVNYLHHKHLRATVCTEGQRLKVESAKVTKVKVVLVVECEGVMCEGVKCECV